MHSWIELCSTQLTAPHGGSGCAKGYKYPLAKSCQILDLEIEADLIQSQKGMTWYLEDCAKQKLEKSPK